MTFNNIELYCQVLGSIMKEPTVLTNLPSGLTIDDFNNENKLARVIFYAISNLIDGGSTKINVSAIEAYLQDYPSFLATYRNERGRDFVAMCLDKGEPESFSAFFSKLKKNSLLKDLKDHGYNISPYDIESVTPGTKEEFDTILRYEEATEEDILGYVEKNFSSIRSRHTRGVGGYTNAYEGLEEILMNLEKAPEQGPELNGEIFNSIVRGALRGKMYLRSGGTNVGKTRWAVFDACSIVFPIKYSSQHNSFIRIKDKIPQKVLFVTTEMDESEIKTIILAYISGVEEIKILRSSCTKEERERIRWALKILEIYQDYFLLERISDPNLNNVQTVIKKHVLLNDVGYVFYDYIFTSPSLINQFSSNNIRQDVALGMLSNQLKEIAITYNVFLITGTQVNGEGLKVGEKRDQRVLRDSKSIADKADCAMLIAQVDPSELESIKAYTRQYGTPTHVTDIYKMRSGTYKGCRIWSKINLGTGERKDLFLTDESGNLKVLDSWEFVPALPAEEIWISENFLSRVKKEEQENTERDEF